MKVKFQKLKFEIVRVNPKMLWCTHTHTHTYINSAAHNSVQSLGKLTGLPSPFYFPLHFPPLPFPSLYIFTSALQHLYITFFYIFNYFLKLLIILNQFSYVTLLCELTNIMKKRYFLKRIVKTFENKLFFMLFQI